MLNEPRRSFLRGHGVLAIRMFLASHLSGVPMGWAVISGMLLVHVTCTCPVKRCAAVRRLTPVSTSGCRVEARLAQQLHLTYFGLETLYYEPEFENCLLIN